MPEYGKEEMEQLLKQVREAGLGNVLASLSPQKRSPKEIRSVDEAVRKIEEAKQAGKTVGFASGCFDILHVGHVLFLGDCKEGADLLFVGVDSNSNVGSAKGPDHPVFDESERLLVVASQEVVDRVFLFDGPCAELLKKLKPTFYCVSPFDPKFDKKQEDAKRAGVKLKESCYYLKSFSGSDTAGYIRMAFLLNRRW